MKSCEHELLKAHHLTILSNLVNRKFAKLVDIHYNIRQSECYYTCHLPKKSVSSRLWVYGGALKTLDECEIVSWRVYVSVELTRQNSLSFSEYHVFVGTCAWSGNQSFMDPFLIVRKYSLVEYIMNAHRVKWLNYSKIFGFVNFDLGLVP